MLSSDGFEFLKHARNSKNPVDPKILYFSIDVENMVLITAFIFCVIAP